MKLEVQTLESVPHEGKHRAGIMHAFGHNAAALQASNATPHSNLPEALFANCAGRYSAEHIRWIIHNVLLQRKQDIQGSTLEMAALSRTLASGRITRVGLLEFVIR